MERGAYRRLAHEPGWRRLYAAATLARVGNEMLAVALLLYVIERTGDEALGGLVVAAVTLPSLASGPLLGGLLDRMSRPSRLLALDQAVMAGALGAIVVLLEAGASWAVLAPAAIAGITFPLSTAGFTTLLPSFVRPELLTTANAVEGSSYSTALVTGPALAAVVALSAGPLAAVAVQIAVKLGALALIAGVHEPARPPAPPEAGSVRLGLRAIARSPALLGVTVGSALALVGRGMLVLAFPLMASQLLGQSEDVSGFLWAAFAVGSILGSLALLPPLHRHPPELVALGALGAGGLVMLTWSLPAALPLALAVVAAGGLLLGPGLGAQIGARQQLAPDELQGQVFMTAASLKVGSYAIGSAVAGGLASAGAEPVLLGAAAFHLAGFAVGTVLLRLAPRRLGLPAHG
jgi:Major Facilitator Superfamily